MHKIQFIATKVVLLYKIRLKLGYGVRPAVLLMKNRVM